MCPVHTIISNRSIAVYLCLGSITRDHNAQESSVRTRAPRTLEIVYRTRGAQTCALACDSGRRAETTMMGLMVWRWHDGKIL